MQTQTNRPPLVLASNSPRRRELLSLLGFPFDIRVASVDESQRPGEAPQDYAERMARDKASAVAEAQSDGAAVIAADTIVVDGEEVLGKPTDLVDAEHMLRKLRGRTHAVLATVAVQRPGSGGAHVDACRTEVPMRDYSDDELARYLDSGDSLDKAGAYGIQNRSFHPVEHLHGCFANVMGLPLCHVTRMMRRMSLGAAQDAPRACQEFTGFECPVYRQVLDGAA